jgi:hypothetical protein
VADKAHPYLPLGETMTVDLATQILARFRDGMPR